MERPLMPMPMSGLPDRGESLGRSDLAPDCDCDRLLRTTTRGRSRSPARRHGSGAGHFAALPARGHALAQPNRDNGAGQRVDPAAMADPLGPDGPVSVARDMSGFG